MTDIVTDLKEATASIDANPIAYLLNFTRIPQVEFHEDKHLMWISTEVPVGLFNSVFNLDFESATDIESTISETVAHFTSRGRPCVWWVGPSAQPADFPDYLAAQGGRLIDTIAMMACSLDSLPKQTSIASSITMECVRDRELLLTWADIYCRSRGYDQIVTKAWYQLLGGLELTPDEPLQHYVGCLNGSPAVCASLFLGVGVAGLFNVTTVPDVRRQGLGRAITFFALADAQERGYRISVLGSEAMAHRLYTKVGFTDHGQLLAYAW
jgi:GNAT superfamily N-acetyltransferase